MRTQPGDHIFEQLCVRVKVLPLEYGGAKATAYLRRQANMFAWEGPVTVVTPNSAFRLSLVHIVPKRGNFVF